MYVPNGRNGGDDLPQLELIEDSRLPCCIETHHQDAHLLLPEHPLPDPGECQPHCCLSWSVFQRGGGGGGGGGRGENEKWDDDDGRAEGAPV